MFFLRELVELTMIYGFFPISPWTLEHLVIDCGQVKALWETLVTWLENNTHLRYTITADNILTGRGGIKV